MEQMIIFVLGACGSILISIMANIITDKIKSHSSTRNRKSGTEFEFKITFKFKNK